jgi:hypothetical protein
VVGEIRWRWSFNRLCVALISRHSDMRLERLLQDQELRPRRQRSNTLRQIGGVPITRKISARADQSDL